MKINLSASKRPEEFKKLIDDIPRRVQNVGRELGRAFSTKVQKEVTKRLMGHGGWVKIYREAIFYRETSEGDEWAVAGLVRDNNLFKYPAETSLASFTATGQGIWLAEYNPWPIDVIPSATYKGTKIVVRAAPESEVQALRAARLANLPALLSELAARGIQVDPTGDTLPDVPNGVFADIAYLAKRLELGYPGFPRLPHWGTTAGIASSQGNRWLSTPTTLRLVENALKGEEPGTVVQLSKAEASELARLRSAAWS